MAIWQISFLLVPDTVAGDASQMNKDTFRRYNDGEIVMPYILPADFETRIGEILPKKVSWSPNLEIWGDESSDDIQIWGEKGTVSSIDFRADIRKIDDALLIDILELAKRVSCVWVERRYLTICRMDQHQFRALIAGHPHKRALADPVAWLPLLAEESKRNEN